MNYSKSLLVYQDDPASGWILRLIILVVPAILLVLSLVLWSSGEDSGGLVLAGESVLVGLIFWAILPRKYQVFEDHLGIALGGPLAIKIGFAQIKTIEVTTRTALTVNWVTTIAQHYVRIAKKKGLSIAITPKSNELFVENANRALGQWKNNNRNEL